jgi:DNA-directed RNA polymerase specialized sigma24 family protein
VWQESYPEDDRRLVEKCQKGDPLAFEELVRKYQQTVFNLAYHYVGYRNEVEDVAQKIFTKVYFSLPKFDLQRPFFPWLYRIAVNQCYDELRRIRRQKTHPFQMTIVRKSRHYCGKCWISFRISNGWRSFFAISKRSPIPRSRKS